MYRKRKFAYLTPESEGGGTVCRSLVIPDTFVHIVSGALATLTEPWNYEKVTTTALEPQRCAEIMAGVLEQYLNSTCGGGGGDPCEYTELDCPAPRRINPTSGRIERWNEELGTWQVDDGDQVWPEPVASPQRPVGQDAVCLAAANAANALLTLYNTALTDFDEQIGQDAALANFLVELVNFGLDLLGKANMYVGVITSFFTSLFDALGVATTNTENRNSHHKLTCFLRNYYSIEGGNLVLLWQDLREDILGDWHGTNINDVLFTLQLAYFVNMIGPAGMLNAAATTAITSFDCDLCDEQEQPSCNDTFIGFDGGKPSWVLVGSGHIIPLYPAPTYTALVGRTDLGALQSSLSSNGTEHAIDILIDLGVDCTLEYVSFWTRTTSYGGGASFPYYIRPLDAAGNQLHSYGGPQGVTTNWIKREVSYGASGLANVRYVRLLSVTLPSLGPCYLDDIQLTFV